MLFLRRQLLNLYKEQSKTIKRLKETELGRKRAERLRLQKELAHWQAKVVSYFILILTRNFQNFNSEIRILIVGYFN